MGYCNQEALTHKLPDGTWCKTCHKPTVLYGKCEAHLTDQERAVMELVQASERYLLSSGDTASFDRFVNAIAAVKEGK